MEIDWSVVLLEKDDFILLDDNRLMVRHPAFQGRGGFVMFYTYWFPDCQDTKTSWSSVGLVKGSGSINKGGMIPLPRSHMISRAKCIKRFPYIKAVRTDGITQDYYGSIPKETIVNIICKKAGLCCDYIKRCHTNSIYYQ